MRLTPRTVWSLSPIIVTISVLRFRFPGRSLGRQDVFAGTLLH